MLLRWDEFSEWLEAWHISIFGSPPKSPLNAAFSNITMFPHNSLMFSSEQKLTTKISIFCLPRKLLCNFKFQMSLKSREHLPSKSQDQCLAALLIGCSQKPRCLLSDLYNFSKKNQKEVRKSYKTVFLQADSNSWRPPPSYKQLLVIVVGVHFTLDYDFMCPGTDFTKEKSHFHPVS